MNGFAYARASFLVFLLLLMATHTLGQRTLPDPTAEAERARRREAAERRESYRTLNDAVRKQQIALEKKTNFYNRKLTEAQKKLITPSAEDQAAYRDFLRQENTGLIRLLPRGKYELTETVDANSDPDAALPIRGGGAFYSFAEKTHTFGPWSEMSLSDGLLITGFARESLGLLVALGDVPLASVTPQSAGVEPLIQGAPPTHYAEAEEVRNHNFQGFKVNSFSYSSALRAIPHTTYVLRSMIYKHEGKLVVLPGSSVTVYMRHPYEYKGADTLIAFRIVRADADGSLTLLWKRLQKFKSPKLKKENRLAVVK